MRAAAVSVVKKIFSLDGKVVVTGATGVLGGAMARGLAQAGARVGVFGRREETEENGSIPKVAAGPAFSARTMEDRTPTLRVACEACEQTSPGSRTGCLRKVGRELPVSGRRPTVEEGD